MYSSSDRSGQSEPGLKSAGVFSFWQNEPVGARTTGVFSFCQNEPVRARTTGVFSFWQNEPVSARSMSWGDLTMTEGASQPGQRL